MTVLRRMQRSFGTGEVTDLIAYRSDFKRLSAATTRLRNFQLLPAGAIKKRAGFKFLISLNTLGLDLSDPKVRVIPFVFNKVQAYSLIFFRHTSGAVRVIFGTQDRHILRYTDPVPTECPAGTPISATAGDVIYIDLPGSLNIQEFDYAQSADDIFIADRNTAPLKLARYGAQCWAYETITFVDQPSEWTGPDDWPRKVTLHQQRLVFASTESRRQTLWLSEVGNFFTFTPAATGGIAADNAITFTLDSGTQNRITWLLSGKALFIGTLGNEWAITGGNQQALTPSNILAQRQTNTGSKDLKPLMINMAAMYVGRHGRSTNEFVYDYNYDGYKSTDILVLAPHLVDEYSIIDWTYQAAPWHTIWCVREDGALLGCTYQREHKILGWHVHATEGKIKGITSIPGDARQDDIWVVTERANGFFVEVSARDSIEIEIQNTRLVDSYVTYTNPGGHDIISGLEHLEGQEVEIVLDGAYHPPRVVNQGSIHLDYSTYTLAVIGLGYSAVVKPIQLSSGLRDGVSEGRASRLIKIWPVFKNTLGGYIYTKIDNTSHIEELAFRRPSDLTGQLPPVFSGMYEWDMPEGWDLECEYEIQQNIALPMTLLGVVELYEVE